MTTAVDLTTCSKCHAEPRNGKSSWGRVCLNGAAKDARDRRKAGLPPRRRGRPAKGAQNGTTEPTGPIHADVAAEIARRQVIREAEASVSLNNDPDMHTCYEGHCAPEPAPERTERTPGHGIWCAGMCCRVQAGG